MSRVHDTVMLSGWLFADLLLALAVLFLVANTSGIKLASAAPPILIVSPTVLDANVQTPACRGGTAAPQCTITIEETRDSHSAVIWTVSTDMSDSIKYTKSSGQLSPGQAVNVTISAIPCQKGSFKFNAQRIEDKVTSAPVIVAWHCVPRVIKPARLDFNYQTFALNVADVNAFLAGSSQDDDIRNQIKNTALLRGKSVGLAIVYGGAPDTGSIGTAQNVAQKIYAILGNIDQSGFQAFAKSSFYVPLYTLGPQLNTVQVDVYFFTQ